MRNARTNEVLAIQIAIISDLAHRLGTEDLGQLQADVEELEQAVATLKDQVKYLPKT